MESCSQLCQRLADFCCRTGGAGAEETTRLTVKCQNRYVSEENLLDNDSVAGGDLPALHRTSPSEVSSRSDAAVTPPLLMRSPLSASETHLDRVQPQSSRMYRPDLDSQSQPSLNEFGSVPEISVTGTDPELGSGADTGKPLTLQRAAHPDLMRHAQTIADISKFTIRDLKNKNRSSDGAGGRLKQFTRASRLGFDRTQYESSGSLTRDKTPEGQPRLDSPDDQKIVEEVYGKVSISISYNPHVKRLVLHLEGISHLPAKGDDKAYDVVAEATLLPDEKSVKKTPVVCNDLNPKYNIEWALPLRHKEVKTRTLRISVYDAARRGPHEAIGHAMLPLNNMVSESPERYQLRLKRRSQVTEPLGRLLVSLSYQPAEDRLSVVVMEARELYASPIIHHLPQKTFEKHAKYDTFAKVSLRCAGEKVKTKRSPVVSSSRDPFYNASFTFVLPPSFVEDASLVVSVVMRGIVRNDLILGRVILGPFFRHGHQQLTEWGRVMTSHEVSTQWHQLHL